MKIIILPTLLLALCTMLANAQAENWIYQYDGPGNSTDNATSIVYGADGNIYAAGSSCGIGTGFDFTVISLTAAGDTNWVYRYDGPASMDDYVNSIIYGADGNIYAAGSSRSSSTFYDFIVISLTAAGDTNWVYRYDGPANSRDNASSIIYGADGNLYAAGSSWGNGTFADFTVISLTTAGDTNWVYRYDGPANHRDFANSIVYGADSNIYAAGSSLGSGTSADFTVISLTTAGDTNWVYTYDGPASMADYANSIIYGTDGNIYAAGNNYGSSTEYDFIVISLTAAGDTNWVYIYNGPGNSNDGANSIIYGADGNIYVAGSSYGSGTFADFTVISLTTAGDTNWVYRYDGTAHLGDNASSISYGADGNLYVAGNSSGDFAVISLTTTGDTNWVYTYNGPGNQYDTAISIAYGADGNIYAAGYCYGSGTASDFTVISLPLDYGVQEEKVKVSKNHIYRSTIFNGPLFLPEGKNCRVFDITGRAVISNKIKPGIYFIEIDGVISQKVIKIK